MMRCPNAAGVSATDREAARKFSSFAAAVKQRRDSIEQFEKGGRPDLVAKEEAELTVIQEFMPAQMSEARLDEIIAETIRETGAAGVRDMGKVMKALMPKVAGKADGKMVGEKVKSVLSA